MSAARPSVSVVMTAYNATWCIERALDSVYAQTVLPTEVLVCDDGSTDGTPELVERRYGARVQVLRLPHRNASATRAVGLARATGDWLAFLDADDRWHPDKLERQLDYLAQHPDIKWIGSDGAYVTDDQVLRNSWLADYFDPVRELNGDLFPALIERCFPLMSSMMVEREAYRSVGGLDPQIVYSHDYDLWLRLGARYPGAMQAESLVDYWSSPGALSKRYEARYRDDLMLMRRVERGELRQDPRLQRIARERCASHEFDLGVMCLRSGRQSEARERLWRATRAGSWRRRLMAAAGAMVPAWLLPNLTRLRWLKGAIVRARRRRHQLSLDGTSEGQP